MKKSVEQIRRVGLIANVDKANCRTLVRRAARLIEESGRTVLMDEPTARLTPREVVARPSAARLTREVDLLMVIGGDGTMLRVAREVAGSRTPIVGINAGGLGFLTDVQSQHLPHTLERIWAGDTILETRSMIEASGQAHGQPFAKLALNEFVVGRGATLRLIELEVRVDHKVLTRYRCDGLIVCSPTGSTAYSLAAGGAVVSPTADVFTLTPICPHTLSNRSVIVGLHSTVQVEVVSKKVDVVLTADGQDTLPLQSQDVVTIRRSQRSIRLLHLADSSFFETLRRKLNWSGSHVRHAHA